MKQKMYIIETPKKKDNVIHITVDPFRIPDKDLLQARLQNKAHVFEDKRFKKPKHKNKEIDYGNY